jgi:hypothetical protein
MSQLAGTRATHEQGVNYKGLKPLVIFVASEKRTPFY